MNVVLEGRLVHAGAWKCVGVWSTDIKKKPIDKLPFASQLVVQEELVGDCGALYAIESPPAVA
jgi:hypothetical protein